MNSQPYDSLRSKLVLPFVLLGFSVSALLSLVTFGLVAGQEERAIERIMQVEMENYRNRLAHNPHTLPPSTSVLTGYFLPIEDFPQISRAKPGQQRIERHLQDDREYSVMITDVDGKPYALFYDRTYVSSGISKLALFLLLGTAVLTLLSLLLGNHLAGKVVRPINRLFAEISARTASDNFLSGSPPSFWAADYPTDEIGHLVKALDRFTVRLHGFLERESCFAGDVSHELRTPAAVIHGATEVLLESPDLPEPVRKRLQTIHRQAVRMGQVLEAMLLLAREESDGGDPACAMAEVVDDAIADVLPALVGRPVNVAVSFAGRPILPIERCLAYVMVSNLLRNACAYTREGTIAVHLSADHLEISDSGIGIAAERFPSLFVRHAKGEESTGYGLGLSIVARIAQRTDWKLDIQSHEGEGTRVRIAFPAYPSRV